MQVVKEGKWRKKGSNPGHIAPIAQSTLSLVSMSFKEEEEEDQERNINSKGKEEKKFLCRWVCVTADNNKRNGGGGGGVVVVCKKKKNRLIYDRVMDCIVSRRRRKLLFFFLWLRAAYIFLSLFWRRRRRRRRPLPFPILFLCKSTRQTAHTDKVEADSKTKEKKREKLRRTHTHTTRHQRGTRKTPLYYYQKKEKKKKKKLPPPCSKFPLCYAATAALFLSPSVRFDAISQSFFFLFFSFLYFFDWFFLFCCGLLLLLLLYSPALTRQWADIVPLGWSKRITDNNKFVRCVSDRARENERLFNILHRHCRHQLLSLLFFWKMKFNQELSTSFPFLLPLHFPCAGRDVIITSRR